MSIRTSHGATLDSLAQHEQANTSVVSSAAKISTRGCYDN